MFGLSAYNGRFELPQGQGYVGDPKWHANILVAGVLLVFVHGLLVVALKATRLPNADIETLLYLISGAASRDESGGTFIQMLAEYFGHICFYFVASILLALVIGACARWFITKRGWDIDFKFLRISNPWHYFFMGADQIKIPDLAVVSATVELEASPIFIPASLSNTTTLPMAVSST